MDCKKTCGRYGLNNVMHKFVQIVFNNICLTVSSNGAGKWSQFKIDVEGNKSHVSNNC